MKKMNKLLVASILSILMAFFLTTTVVYAMGYTWYDVFSKGSDTVSGEDWDNLIDEIRENNPGLIYPGVDFFITERNANNLLKSKWFDLYSDAYNMSHTSPEFINLSSRESQLQAVGRGYLKHIISGVDASNNPFVIVQYFTDIREVRTYTSDNSNIAMDERAVIIGFNRLYQYRITKDIDNKLTVQQGNYFNFRTTGTAQQEYIIDQAYHSIPVIVEENTYYTSTNQVVPISDSSVTVMIIDYGLFSFPDLSYGDPDILAWWVHKEKI